MNPYRVLKVSRDAPGEVIRAAYKVLASKYHPDKNPGNAQAARTMQHVNDAYALLSDPIRRSEYDRKAKTDSPAPAPKPQRSGVKKVTIYCRNCSCAIRVPEEVLSASANFNVTCPDCRKDPFAAPFRDTEPPAEPLKSTIVCKHCGQSIRVLSDAIRHPDRFEVTCPKCHQDPVPRPDEYRYEQKPLDKPPIDNLMYVRSFFGAVFGLVKVGFFIVIVIAFLASVMDFFAKSKTHQTQSSAPPPRPGTTPPAPAQPPAFSQPALPLPQTGDNTAPFFNGVAPLTIKTSSAGGHYFVKVVSAGSNLELGSYFIRSGQTLTIQVPLGTYELRYASGRQWYGTNYLFGPDTSYNKADSLFEFTFDGYQYSGYTVELITQRNGNLRTSKLQPGQW